MSIFKKLFGKEEENSKSADNNPDEVHQPKADWHSFDELLDQHAGLSFEKQMIFGEVIDNHAWQFDMNNGTISFGSELSFNVQIIGSLSFNDQSWMWGWANTKSGMPENLLQYANQLKVIGEEKNIIELTDGHYSVDEGFEHKMGMAACGYFKSKSYYCANYGQGTLVVLIDDDRIPAVDFNRLEKVLTSFPQLISAVAVNHRHAFENYLIDRSFNVNASDAVVEGVWSNKTVTAEFDELGRLKSLNGNL